MSGWWRWRSQNCKLSKVSINWRPRTHALCNRHSACRPAQFAEETKRADRVVPHGVVWSVVGTAVLGSSFLLTLLFCIQVQKTKSTIITLISGCVILTPKQCSTQCFVGGVLGT